MPAADRREGADLIVVGASAGGLTAAITAADRGCQVIIVERTKDLGGGAAGTGEAVVAAGSRWQQEAGIADDPERLAADLLASGVSSDDAQLVAALAAQSAPLVEWLADRCGATIQLLPAGVGGHHVARLHACTEHGGASLVAALGRVVGRHHRIRVRTATEVTQLLHDDGGVTGVAVKPDRRGSPTIAGRVLLACGGFVAEDSLVGQHCPEAASLPLLAAPYATGDGLRLASAVGAQPRGLDRCEVTALFALPAQLEVPPTMLAAGAILVNQAGRRFADESLAPLALAETVRAQPGHVAYLVFDDRIATAIAADPFVEHVVLPRAGRRGGTPTDLAKQLELSAEGLEETVASGSLQAPLRAIRVTGARLRTLGGLVVDQHARVLDTGGRPLAGLYAAGGVTAALAPGASQLAPLSALGLGRLAALDVIAAEAAGDQTGSD
jgi:succinate dehydrogenase/fumarate reductase flavoprotein subunit